MITKDYSLDTSDLAESYIDNLVRATEEFCGNEELVDAVDNIFEDAYRTAVDEPPKGNPPEHLKKKD